jgi:predicted GNAT family N-acyltransferase
MAATTVARATTIEEIHAVQRLRHAVYVEEMSRYHDVNGSDDGRFAEPEDDHSWIFYARVDGEVVAATRLTWGGHGFSDRQIAQYQLAPFLDELPAALMLVGERNTALAAHRGTGVVDTLLMQAGAESFAMAPGMRLAFGCCEPHLLPMYLKMGQRTYARTNINSPVAGYLIPLVAFIPDVEALRGLGERTHAGDLPRCIADIVAQGGTVRSEALTAPDQYWGEVREMLELLDGQQFGAFDGLSQDEIRRCIARSTIIECRAGDRVLKRGGAARNIFVVLAGILEVRSEDGRVVNVLRAGDAFGEMAFLLERPRSFDVDAVTDDTRILSLSDGAMRRMIAEDSTVAAKVLMNIARMLCVRLIRAS